MPSYCNLENEHTEYESVVVNNQASLSHELLGGGIAFEACKAFEEKCAREGRPQNHARAQEILAGIAGAICDREFETRGLNFLDREEARRQATYKATQCITESDYETEC